MPLSPEERAYLEGRAPHPNAGHRIAPNPAQHPRLRQYDKRDLTLAVRDLVRLRMMGPRRAGEVNPVAESLFLEDCPLERIAEELYPSTNTRQATTQSDWLDLITPAFAEAVAIGYSQQSKAYENLLYDISAQDFKGIETALVDLGMLDELVEDGEPGHVNISVSDGVTANVRTFAKVFKLSRRAWSNLGLEGLNLALSMLGAQAARREQQLIASQLEANPTLGDGSNLFTGANALTGYGSTSAASLDAAGNVLRTQETGTGEPANLTLKYLIIPPEMEASSHVLLTAMQPPSEREPRVQAVVNPWLTTADTFYAFASPSEGPCLARYYLAGTNGQPTVMTTKLKSGGYGWSIFHDVEIKAVSRLGAVRVTA